MGRSFSPKVMEIQILRYTNCSYDSWTLATEIWHGPSGVEVTWPLWEPRAANAHVDTVPTSVTARSLSASCLRLPQPVTCPPPPPRPDRCPPCKGRWLTHLPRVVGSALSFSTLAWYSNDLIREVGERCCGIILWRFFLMVFYWGGGMLRIMRRHIISFKWMVSIVDQGDLYR